jgi:hypothetical protein
MQDAGEHTHPWKGFKKADNGGKWVRSDEWIDADHVQRPPQSAAGNHNHVINGVADHTHTIQPSGTESRPKNAAIWYIIKY